MDADVYRDRTGRSRTVMARAPWNRPGESAQIRRLRIVLFWTTVVLVVVLVATLVHFVVRSAEIAGL
ncbi:hypothetical protein AB1K56_11845 [Microbacterium sp. BWR-S6Y]|uniref:hypothetical protein n=1 Tax=Microbacterium sp. BWR-S6Y TaxID=3232073 RepID=UPI00352737DE